jgi:hypothetical protein
MKAVILSTGNSINRSHRKEDKFLEEISCFVMTKEKTLKNVVILRTYGTQAKNYVCLWAHGENKHTSGSGSAGGYGYHRPSAAAAEAISAAGIKINQNISGRGDTAIIEAAEAIAKTLYPRRKIYTHKAHG